TGFTPPVKTGETSNLFSKPGTSHRFTPVAHPNNECATAYALPPLNPSLPLMSYQVTTLQSTQSLTTPTCGAPPGRWDDVWFTFSKPANITNFEIFTDSLDCR